MPTPTYTALATTTLTSASSPTISFQSISQAYQDLIISLSVKNTTGNPNYAAIRVNNVSSGIYTTTRYFYTSGTTVSQYSLQSEIPSIGWETGYTNAIGGFAYIEIPSYASNTAKQITQSTYCVTNGSNTQQCLEWFNTGLNYTSPINRVDFILVGTGEFAIGSTATLWGRAV